MVGRFYWAPHWYHEEGSSKAVGPQLEDILIDIDNSMNNQPLLYQGEQFE